MICLSCKMEEMEGAKNTYFAPLDNYYAISENVASKIFILAYNQAA